MVGKITNKATVSGHVSQISQVMKIREFRSIKHRISGNNVEIFMLLFRGIYQ